MKNQYLITAILIALFILIRVWLKWRKTRRRQQIFDLKTPDHWVQMIRKKVAIYHFLPDHLQQELLGMEPRPLADTARDTVNWYRRLGYC